MELTSQEEPPSSLVLLQVGSQWKRWARAPLYALLACLEALGPSLAPTLRPGVGLRYEVPWQRHHVAVVGVVKLV